MYVCGGGAGAQVQVTHGNCVIPFRGLLDKEREGKVLPIPSSYGQCSFLSLLASLALYIWM